MNIVIFDTETTSLEKPFCYNIGYVILNTETGEIIKQKDFVCEQVWHNPMLFTTAYYANKRPIYIDSMRKHLTTMNKFGYICQEMIRDFKAYEIELAFAYNSAFDEKVFNFNCDWFKCNNPFDTITICDIRGYAHQFIINDNYKQFCETNELFTDSGNYSTTAETMYQYITNNVAFKEEHTALSDSIIETEILKECLRNGAELGGNYQALKSIPRKISKTFTVKNGTTKEILYETECFDIMWKKSSNTIIVK